MEEVACIDPKALKRELKEWENEFYDEEGRKPTKADIQANREIAKKYKLYSKLKANAEERPVTLQDSVGNSNETLVSSSQRNSFVEKPTYSISYSTASKPAVHATPEPYMPARKTNSVPYKARMLNVTTSPQPTGNHADLSQSIKAFTLGDKGFKKAPSRRPVEQEETIDDCPEIDAFITRKQEIQQLTADARPWSAASDASEKGFSKAMVKPLQSSLQEFEVIVLPPETSGPRPSLLSAFVDKKAKQVEEEKEKNERPDIKKNEDDQDKPAQNDAEAGEQPKEDNEPKTESVASDKPKTPAVDHSLGSHKTNLITRPNLFGRLPNDGSILRCKLIRKRNILDKKYPTFLLFNEADNTVILAARKRMKTKVPTYVISSNAEDLSKDSFHYLAKLKANQARTNFILFDARGYRENLANKGLKEMTCIYYSKTVLPREFSVGVPPEESNCEESQKFTEDILADFKSHNIRNLLFIKNKKPRWNDATQSHCLNFGGRVTQPSIKNFQLIKEEDPEEKLIMQFGRCDNDWFAMDVRYPMTPIQAFAIALTTFDAYDHA